MACRLIITDVDGCLSPEASVSWDLKSLWRLIELSREASARRGKMAPLTLCTGRPQPYVEALMKLLDIRAPAICESGSVIYTLSDNRARLAPGVTAENIRALRTVRGFIEAQILPDYPGRAVIQFGKEAHLSIFSEQPEIFAAIQSRIEQFTGANKGPELAITTSHFYLNISPAGVDKGRTLRALLEELGIPAAQAAGIGDTESDLPLRREVGFFACPANSREVIKAVADYVSPYPELEGVLDILSRPEFQLD